MNGLTVDEELQHLNLIDLLSERHSLIRTIGEKAWNDQSTIKISNAEWYILARIYQKEPTITYVRKHVAISRQAIHKHIRNLESKGLVEINDVKHNKKEKYVRLTRLGDECFEKNMEIQARLERKIVANIGHDQIENLKSLLKLNWGIEQDES